MKYRQNLGLTPATLVPNVHSEGDHTWIYPLMDAVIDGIRSGDAACVQIGIDFIEEDEGFPFGRTLKSNTARALRRSVLTSADKNRIRARVVEMLARGNIPYEFRDYAKLLKRIGLAEFRTLIETFKDSEISRVNRYAKFLLDN
ncbi:MAG: hypothetical protein HUU46_10545 [Candidatus Hydrogenedentes bacterium]|nr:hypothetical protein [Candidatus Hydrogenedentota bacterium]